MGGEIAMASKGTKLSVAKTGWYKDTEVSARTSGLGEKSGQSKRSKIRARSAQTSISGKILSHRCIHTQCHQLVWVSHSTSGPKGSGRGISKTRYKQVCAARNDQAHLMYYCADPTVKETARGMITSKKIRMCMKCHQLATWCICVPCVNRS